MLADGRVLIADQGENRLVVADLGNDVITPVGRVGSGPGEFERVGRLFALSGDSTLLLDEGHGARWLLLRGAEIVGTVTAGDRVRSTLRLVQRGTGTSDSLSTTHGIATVFRTTGSDESLRRFMLQVVFSIAEQAVLFPDGWVAIARQVPYQVEWFSPDGRRRVSAVLPWSYPSVSDAEKRAWELRVTDGGRVANQVPIAARPFADVIPPYGEEALLTGPEGRLLIARPLWTGSQGNEYHLVSRDERPLALIRLPANVRIVGFDPGAVYTAITNDDGIERLRRHPWP